MAVERTFREGDFVLVELPDRSVRVIKVERGKRSATKYGLISHDDIIGREEGVRVKTSAGHMIPVVRPTLFDLQLGYCERVTQVVYPKDSAIMVEYAEVASGDVVFEAGVGSGFLTMLLACRVAPSGMVYGFDVNPKALDVARHNLDLVGCTRSATLINHDVRLGIPVRGAKAGFFDIPDPWNALSHAWEALVPGGRLFIFVPTVNQLVRVLKSLKEEGFGFVRVFESMHREYEVDPDALRPISVQVTHTGYIVFSRKLLK